MAEKKTIEEWVSLRDADERIQARYCPQARILAIKSRGKETRWNLNKIDSTCDSSGENVDSVIK